ncbi:putative folylpolyglutamate synthase [Triangularia setosa]|uniref:Folylpolyglutamate synthase n=1 Tax=Triangularia setosa TaxID=2587417 RepID=A0AAN6WA75_9PEZI|nr:putative folylpolyglutamate synthase [Podospora setosa]
MRAVCRSLPRQPVISQLFFRNYQSSPFLASSKLPTFFSPSPPIPSSPTATHPQFHHTTPKMASSPDYQKALSRLSALQSNLAITSLFSIPLPDNTDRNAAAIPEMLFWLSRAALSPETIAASGLKCVHVAGTKGKGSVSAFVGSILAQYSDQEKVGVYTSPHLVDQRERISLLSSGGDGVMIGEEKFGQYVNLVWDTMTEEARKQLGPDAKEEDLEGPGTKPFYFRFLTIVALRAFIEEGVKDAVIECGIGGEYDSTNILPKESVTAAVVTQLGIDHVGMLGDTVEKITWHKAGIFKEGMKAFTIRHSKATVGEVLRERAKEKGAELMEISEEEVRAWKGVQGGRLQGPFQKGNMALAVYAAREHLIKTGHKFEGRFGVDGEGGLDDIPEEFVKGLKEASLRGRCEVVRDGKDGMEWLVDGAHTEDSLVGVGDWFASRTVAARGTANRVRILVFNQQERDPKILLTALLKGAGQKAAGSKEVFTHAFFTRNEELPPRMGEKRDLAVQTKAEETMKEYNSAVESKVCDNVSSTIEEIRALAAKARAEGKECHVLATGSFHLVGAVLRRINE